jgi:hypothetical protein
MFPRSVAACSQNGLPAPSTPLASPDRLGPWCCAPQNTARHSQSPTVRLASTSLIQWAARAARSRESYGTGLRHQRRAPASTILSQGHQSPVKDTSSSYRERGAGLSFNASVGCKQGGKPGLAAPDPQRQVSHPELASDRPRLPVDAFEEAICPLCSWAVQAVRTFLVLFAALC